MQHDKGASEPMPRKKTPMTAAEMGKRGGKARAKKLGKKKLSEIGRKMVLARWKKAKKKST
jgi:general stress protein YciG